MTNEHEAIKFLYKFYQHKCIMCERDGEHLVYMTNRDWILLLKHMEKILGKNTD